MDKALHWIGSGRGPSVRGSPSAIMLELGLPPIHACLAALRSRAFAKYSQEAKTVVKALFAILEIGRAHV